MQTVAAHDICRVQQESAIQHGALGGQQVGQACAWHGKQRGVRRWNRLGDGPDRELGSKALVALGFGVADRQSHVQSATLPGSSQGEPDVTCANDCHVHMSSRLL